MSIRAKTNRVLMYKVNMVHFIASFVKFEVK